MTIHRPRAHQRTMQAAREGGFVNSSELVIGGSGEGKSENVQRRLMPQIGKKAIVLVDQPGATAEGLLRRICGKYGRLLVDHLRRKDRVMRQRLMATSESDDPVERDEANKLEREQFLQIGRDAPELDEKDFGPLKHYYADLALHLYQRCPREIRNRLPFTHLPLIFDTFSGVHRLLCDTCCDQSLVFPFIRGRTPHESTPSWNTPDIATHKPRNWLTICFGDAKPSSEARPRRPSTKSVRRSRFTRRANGPIRCTATISPRSLAAAKIASRVAP